MKHPKIPLLNPPMVGSIYAMKTFFILILLGCVFNCDAQEKRDHVWLFGKYPNDEANRRGGSRVDFNFEPPLVSFFHLPENFDFHEISMISDGEGKLQFYSDGCSIINFTHQLMENGDSLNPGKQYNLYCGDGIGYPTIQGSIILPQPETDHIYYLFHIGIRVVLK